MPSDGDIYKVLLEIEMPNVQLGANVFYWRLDDPEAVEPSKESVTNAIEAHLETMYQEIDQLISDEYTFSDAYIDRIAWDGAKWETVEDMGSEVINITGTETGDACPHGVACVVTADTPKPKTRARKFIPGVIETAFTDSSLNASLVTALVAWAARWLTDKVVTGSAKLVPGVVTKLGTWEPIILAAVNAIAGYQRRRKPGVGA